MMRERAEAATVDAGTTRAADGAILHCADLRKSFGNRTVVDGVGFSIAPGQAFGLLGPNGADKTAVISMVVSSRLSPPSLSSCSPWRVGDYGTHSRRRDG